MGYSIREAFTSDHSRGKWFLALGITVLALLLGGLLFIALSVLDIGSSVRKQDALHYPVPQQVISRVGGVGYDGPAIRLGESVEVRATKCSDATTPIITFGVTTQSTVAPGGINSTGSIAANLRLPGCVTSTYSNTLDLAVEHRVAGLLADGTHPFVVMRISGFESPVDQHYTSVEWFTQDFRVYPPLNPPPDCCSVRPSAPGPSEEKP